MSNLTGVASHPQTSQTATSIDITREIAASPQRVFDVFTTQFATWWPKEFRLGSSELTDVVVEPFEGGRWYERLADGTECDWGRVLVWDPPHRLVLTWQIGIGFTQQSDPEQASQLELRFEPVDNGGTRLVLTHDRFERHGEGWESMHASLAGDDGWSAIIARFGEHASSQLAEYGTVGAKGAIRFERLLPGPIDRVWRFLVDSELRGHWLATGNMASRIGESFVLRFKHAELSPVAETLPEKYADFADGCELGCSLTRFDPPNELAYTWGGDSEVSFRLRQDGDRVHLTLLHTLLADSEIVSVASGWHVHLANLADRLEGRQTKPFWAEHLRVEGDYERLLA